LPRAADCAQVELLAWQDDPKLHIDLRAALMDLEHAWTNEAIERIEILHIREEDEFPHNVSSSVVELNWQYILAIRRPESSKTADGLIRAIKGETAELTSKVTDLRWGCLFYDKKENRIISIYFDKTGRKGVINGACVSFKSNKLLKWAKTLKSALR
jgi:hypothetical protein